MKKYLILHGHFYQPPRANPRTGLIARQESAAPYHDWNCRITKEAYAANSASRYLWRDGSIADIVNNYEYLSFNFGPSLLDWLQEKAPQVYRRILHADARSQERCGHGNAIAQAYNHTILPLDEEDDARLQIRWGIDHFYHHFGRKPEGMWLAECAVNPQIVDLLIAEGIHYIILAPWQAEAYRKLGEKRWKENKSSEIPWWQSYLVRGKEGTIAAFFYNQELASGISFNHLLRNADSLYKRIVKIFPKDDEGNLLHAASDGEIYGHHEAFGDMGLAALIKRIQSEQSMEITNYAAYLEQAPPRFEAHLAPGDKGLGTSWSCFHGVSRWREDCGCSTGGQEAWNQRWRAPLREGLLKMSRAMKEQRAVIARKIGCEPFYPVLSDYGRLLSGATDRKAFCEKWKIAAEQKEQLFSLLEAERMRLYAFTSCGWFFADIAGIEPVQNLRFALRSCELYHELSGISFDRILERELAQAQSNLPDHRSGAEILQELREECLPRGIEAALFFHIQEGYSSSRSTLRRYGQFSLEEISRKREGNTYESSMRIIEEPCQKTIQCRIQSCREEGKIALSLHSQGEQSLDLEPEELVKLPYDLREAIGSLFNEELEQQKIFQDQGVFCTLQRSLDWSKELGISVGRAEKKEAELLISARLRQLLPLPPSELSPQQLSELQSHLHFAGRHKLDFDRQDAGQRFTAYLAKHFSLSAEFTGKEAEGIIGICTLAKDAGIEIDTSIPQNILFSQLSSWRTLIAEKQGIISKRDSEALQPIVELCDLLQIYSEDVKSVLA